MIFPTGYQDRKLFERKAEHFRTDTSDDRFFEPADKALDEHYRRIITSEMWSSVHRERILFLTYWIKGGHIGAEDAVFGGRLIPSPLRPGNHKLKHNESEVDETVSLLQGVCPDLEPIAVVALFNLQETDNIADNGTPPNNHRRAYGIARISDRKLGKHYAGPHELGHSALGWADEYVEESLASVNVHEFDRLTPLVISDQGPAAAALDMLSNYDMRLSEIVFANGYDNMSLVKKPGRVDSPDGVLSSEEYKREGAKFGLGIY